MEALSPSFLSGDVVLKGIYIYPIKSLDGISCESAEIGNGNSLLNDRRFAILDSDNKLVNGKRNNRVHSLRCRFDLQHVRVQFQSDRIGISEDFDLTAGNPSLDEYLSEHFEKTVRIEANAEGQFLDDPAESGVTLIADSTLSAISDWFGWADPDEVLRRLRPNLVVGGLPPFAEETLVGDAEQRVCFNLGESSWRVTKTCPRCVVPSRHPVTGEVFSGFQNQFVEHRKGQLFSEKLFSASGHYYHASVCCVPIKPSVLKAGFRLGDIVVPLYC